jgi:hypothetical protein
MCPSVNLFLGSSFTVMRVRVRDSQDDRESEDEIDDGKNRIVG